MGSEPVQLVFDFELFEQIHERKKQQKKPHDCLIFFQFFLMLH